MTSHRSGESKVAEPTSLADDDGALLDALATAARLLVVSDFDGVLAPIVDDPDAARPLGRSIDALRRLATLPDTAVAVISGRRRADLVAWSGLDGIARLIGSHGFETGDGSDVLDPELIARRDAVAAALDEIARAAPGAFVEHKATGAALHYRRVAPTRHDQLLDAVRVGPAALPDVRTKPGKMVIELTVTGADKGTALAALAEELAASVVVFAGDDVTDEDAFVRLGPDDIGIKIGDGPTAATHRLPGPGEFADFLDALAHRRAGRAED